MNGREVDFLITERRKPRFLVEAKWSDEPVTRGLNYLKIRFPDAEVYLVPLIAFGYAEHCISYVNLR